MVDVLLVKRFMDLLVVVKVRESIYQTAIVSKIKYNVSQLKAK